MSKTVVMAEYQGRCDEQGTAVGHAPKVLKEYRRILSDEGVRVTVCAPAVILKAAEFGRGSDVMKLDHHILMKAKNTPAEKIFNKIKMFANIRRCLKAEGDTVWFFNTEFYFFLYIAVFGNAGRNIYANTFIGGFEGGVLAALKQKIFERAQKKIRGMITTGASFEMKNTKSIFIPDYSYDPEVYEKFRKKEKKDIAVCLGTMGAEKKLEEMVDAFNDSGYPLRVVGRFYDKERYAGLKAKAASNIEIRDEYPSRDEYLEMLGSARFVVLPYPVERYAIQTSGVLQEAVFLDTVPLTYRAILEGNRIPGGGFDELSDCGRLIAGTDFAPLLKEYERLRNEVFDRRSFAGKLKGFMEL